jgi:hypothetical protein
MEEILKLSISDLLIVDSILRKALNLFGLTLKFLFLHAWPTIINYALY